ncbi:MAG: flagellar basal body L-ring protein FlgH [Pseudomonadota bacterium]
MNKSLASRLRATAGSRGATMLYAALCASLMAGCTSMPNSIVQGPVVALPIPRPASVERVNNGSLFPQSTLTTSVFSGRRKPRSVGDTLKVDISENFNASNTAKTDTSRESALKSKGPGSSSSPYSLIKGLLDQDATASGSSSFKGNGTARNNSSFTGQLAASVISVLTNGNLVVAGERSISVNGGISTIRFSGIVDPKDFDESNVIASSDVVNARLEVAGQGDVSDSATRSWLQRVLSNTLTVW